MIREHLGMGINTEAEQRDQAGQLLDDLQKVIERSQERVQTREGQVQTREERVQDREGQLRLREENLRQEIWNELWENMLSHMDIQTQEAQRQEGNLRSREELRVQDGSPSGARGMQEQLQGELRGQEESRARVRQLREQIKRELWEQEDLPRDERLNELLKQRVGNIIHDHHLIEELYPNQQHWELLRRELLNLHMNVLSDYAHAELQPQNISIEFIDHIEEQMEKYHRPGWETLQIMEDIQERVTGSRPQREPQH
jgi:hypothetical protein